MRIYPLITWLNVSNIYAFEEHQQTKKIVWFKGAEGVSWHVSEWESRVPNISDWPQESEGNINVFTANGCRNY